MPTTEYLNAWPPASYEWSPAAVVVGAVLSPVLTSYLVLRAILGSTSWRENIGISWLHVCPPGRRLGLQGGVPAALGQAIWCLSQAESALPKRQSQRPFPTAGRFLSAPWQRAVSSSRQLRRRIERSWQIWSVVYWFRSLAIGLSTSTNPEIDG
jgi:hypothetical protein